MDEVYTRQPVQGRAGGTGYQQSQVRAHTSSYTAAESETDPGSLFIICFKQMESLCVRLLVEQVLQDTAEDLRVQCSSVDRAFSERCVELNEAKTQLNMQLKQVDELTDRVNDWLLVYD